MTTEPCPLTFKSSAEAVYWAEKLLTSTNRYDKIPLIPPKVKLEGCVDLAHTISVEVSRLEFPVQQVYRYVHGRTTLDIDEVISYLTSRSWVGRDDKGLKNMRRCRQLAALLVDARRRKEQAINKLTMRDIAKRMGMQKTRYYELWIEEQTFINKDLDRLLEKGESELNISLGRLGVLG